MRVFTQNVWNREGPWEQRLQADLIGMQQVRDVDHVREIRGPQYRVAWMRDQVSGIAEAARWTIRDQQQLILQSEGTRHGGVAFGRCTTGGVSFRCTTIER